MSAEDYCTVKEYMEELMRRRVDYFVREVLPVSLTVQEREMMRQFWTAEIGQMGLRIIDITNRMYQIAGIDIDSLALAVLQDQRDRPEVYAQVLGDYVNQLEKGNTSHETGQ